MNFKRAVRETVHLKDALCSGLGALRREDKPHVAVEKPRMLRGSVYLDEALKHVPAHASANRWDFAIAYQHANRSSECVYWVEPHTASTSEVETVLRKMRWLKDWLATDGRHLDSFERDFVWVSSGKTAFTLTAPQQKRFAQYGLQQKGGRLQIKESRVGAAPPKRRK